MASFLAARVPKLANQERAQNQELSSERHIAPVAPTNQGQDPPGKNSKRDNRLWGSGFRVWGLGFRV